MLEISPMIIEQKAKAPTWKSLKIKVIDSLTIAIHSFGWIRFEKLYDPNYNLKNQSFFFYSLPDFGFQQTLSFSLSHSFALLRSVIVSLSLEFIFKFSTVFVFFIVSINDRFHYIRFIFRWTLKRWIEISVKQSSLASSRIEMIIISMLTIFERTKQTIKRKMIHSFRFSNQSFFVFFWSRWKIKKKQSSMETKDRWSDESHRRFAHNSFSFAQFFFFCNKTSFKLLFEIQLPVLENFRIDVIKNTIEKF